MFQSLCSHPLHFTHFVCRHTKKRTRCEARSHSPVSTLQSGTPFGPQPQSSKRRRLARSPSPSRTPDPGHMALPAPLSAGLPPAALYPEVLPAPSSSQNMCALQGLLTAHAPPLSGQHGALLTAPWSLTPVPEECVTQLSPTPMSMSGPASPHTVCPSTSPTDGYCVRAMTAAYSDHLPKLIHFAQAHAS